jgi:hypothetical protein
MTVTVMKFRAGAQQFAVAAGCVERVGPPQSSAPHLTWVLGRGIPEFAGGARTLLIATRGTRSEVTVDGPIELVDLAADDIAPCRTTTSPVIMGFARTSSGVVALLDADRFVEILASGPRGNEAPDLE